MPSSEAPTFPPWHEGVITITKAPFVILSLEGGALPILLLQEADGGRMKRLLAVFEKEGFGEHSPIVAVIGLGRRAG